MSEGMDWITIFLSIGGGVLGIGGGVGLFLVGLAFAIRMTDHSTHNPEKEE